MTRFQRTRRGVTLVEMLVAAALCIAGMSLMTWLYQQGLESFRFARAQADLTAQQRMVTTIMTRDLQAPHFMDEDSKPNRGRRVSDQRLDQMYLYQDPADPTGNRLLVGGYIPPRGGYFRARSLPVGNAIVPNPNNVFEANSDGFDSSLSTDHVIQFIVLLPGGSSFQQFSAEVPASSGFQYFGTAAEVMYYLRFTGQTPGGVNLYELYRHQRLVARSTDDAPAYKTPASYPDAPEVMAVTGGTMRTLGDLTIPAGFPNSLRLVPNNPTGLPATPLPPTSPRYGEDKLMSNVLSFEIKFTGPAVNLGAGAWPSDPSSTQWPRPLAVNSDYPFDNLPFDGQFDTFSTQASTPTVGWNWSNNYARVGNPGGSMKPLRLTAIKVTLRTWDSKTRTTRQTSFIVDI